MHLLNLVDAEISKAASQFTEAHPRWAGESDAAFLSRFVRWLSHYNATVEAIAARFRACTPDEQATILAAVQIAVKGPG